MGAPASNGGGGGLHEATAPLCQVKLPRSQWTLTGGHGYGVFSE